MVIRHTKEEGSPLESPLKIRTLLERRKTAQFTNHSRFFYDQNLYGPSSPYVEGKVSVCGKSGPNKSKD